MNISIAWLQFNFLDWLACIVFLISWIGYTRFAIYKSKTTPALATALHHHRQQWMLNAVSSFRAETARDIIAVGSFARTVSFFASTTILILAGLLTVLGSSEKVTSVLASLHFVNQAILEQIQLKILLIILLFAHAFFKFCWSMRCYDFLTTLLGAVPLHFFKETEDGQEPNEEMREWSNRVAEVMSTAAHHFNLGLRAYYFCLALFAWFIHPLFFILASIVVVGVLYRRDFKSYVLENLQSSMTNIPNNDD